MELDKYVNFNFKIMKQLNTLKNKKPLQQVNRYIMKDMLIKG